MLEENRVEYVSFQNWKFGKSQGAYDCNQDVIYILLTDEEKEMERALRHELKHRERRNKITARIASLIATPVIKNITLMFLFFSLVYGLVTVLNGLPDFSAFLALSIVYLTMLFSRKYEEFKANQED